MLQLTERISWLKNVEELFPVPRCPGRGQRWHLNEKGDNISAGSSGPGGQDGGNRLSRPKRNSEGSNMKLDDDMIPECFQSTQSSM